jgi:hypothetical protein
MIQVQIRSSLVTSIYALALSLYSSHVQVIHGEKNSDYAHNKDGQFSCGETFVPPLLDLLGGAHKPEESA